MSDTPDHVTVRTDTFIELGVETEHAHIDADPGGRGLWYAEAAPVPPGDEPDPDNWDIIDVPASPADHAAWITAADTLFADLKAAANRLEAAETWFATEVKACQEQLEAARTTYLPTHEAIQAARDAEVARQEAEADAAQKAKDEAEAARLAAEDAEQGPREWVAWEKPEPSDYRYTRDHNVPTIHHVSCATLRGKRFEVYRIHGIWATIQHTVPEITGGKGFDARRETGKRLPVKICTRCGADERLVKGIGTDYILWRDATEATMQPDMDTAAFLRILRDAGQPVWVRDDDTEGFHDNIGIKPVEELAEHEAKIGYVVSGNTSSGGLVRRAEKFAELAELAADLGYVTRPLTYVVGRGDDARSEDGWMAAVRPMTAGERRAYEVLHGHAPTKHVRPEVTVEQVAKAVARTGLTMWTPTKAGQPAVAGYQVNKGWERGRRSDAKSAHAVNVGWRDPREHDNTTTKEERDAIYAEAAARVQPLVDALPALGYRADPSAKGYWVSVMRMTPAEREAYAARK